MFFSDGEIAWCEGRLDYFLVKHLLRICEAVAIHYWLPSSLVLPLHCSLVEEYEKEFRWLQDIIQDSEQISYSAFILPFNDLYLQFLVTETIRWVWNRYLDWTVMPRFV